VAIIERNVADTKCDGQEHYQLVVTKEAQVTGQEHMASKYYYFLLSSIILLSSYLSFH
jgi:hypothetical protein